MSFPTPTFPLIADFGSAGYWIGEQGPFKYGSVVTALFIGENIAEVSNDGIPLMHGLQRQLQTFGVHLHPYARTQSVDAELFLWLEKSAVDCPMCFAFHPTRGSVGVMAERHAFQTLRDFLYGELGKAIAHGNMPCQCRLCGRWFLHEQGGRIMYCDRITPEETERTCREAGARAVFEKKARKGAPGSSTSGHTKNTTPE